MDEREFKEKQAELYFQEIIDLIPILIKSTKNTISITFATTRKNEFNLEIYCNIYENYSKLSEEQMARVNKYNWSIIECGSTKRFIESYHLLKEVLNILNNIITLDKKYVRSEVSEIITKAQWADFKYTEKEKEKDDVGEN